MSAAVTKEYREVIVSPLAAGRELAGLMVAICLILSFIVLRSFQVAPKETSSGSKAYQIRDIRLKNQAPVMYRSLLGAVDSITWTYEAGSNWPDIAALEAEALPPFVGNFLPAGLRGFVWEMHRGATWVDYYGVNKNAKLDEEKGADPLENSFILRIIDLQAGKYPYPYVQSASENRFSAQIWVNPQTVDYPEGGLVKRGWKWVVSGNAPVDGKVADGKIIEPAGS
ncbi:MAG: hypothetical protein ACL93V_04175 [Candidatus Electrothrix sp. YB6]